MPRSRSWNWRLFQVSLELGGKIMQKTHRVRKEIHYKYMIHIYIIWCIYLYVICWIFWNIKKYFQIVLKCPFSNWVKWRPSMGSFDGPEANWVWRCRRWLQVTKLVSTEFSPKNRKKDLHKVHSSKLKKGDPSWNIGFTKKRVGSLHVHIPFFQGLEPKRGCLVWRWGV